jgi:mono/diheme cytochrome c family protein
MSKKRIFTILLACLAGAGLAQAQTRGEALRGELLYSTHCIGCHSTQLHWRDKKVATNWATLSAEVDRWQKVSGLGWREEDVSDVARYLNALYYGFPAPDAAPASTADATTLPHPRP